MSPSAPAAKMSSTRHAQEMPSVLLREDVKDAPLHGGMSLAGDFHRFTVAPIMGFAVVGDRSLAPEEVDLEMFGEERQPTVGVLDARAELGEPEILAHADRARSGLGWWPRRGKLAHLCDQSTHLFRMAGSVVCGRRRR